MWRSNPVKFVKSLRGSTFSIILLYNFKNSKFLRFAKGDTSTILFLWSSKYFKFFKSFNGVRSEISFSFTFNFSKFVAYSIPFKLFIPLVTENLKSFVLDKSWAFPNIEYVFLDSSVNIGLLVFLSMNMDTSFKDSISCFVIGLSSGLLTSKFLFKTFNNLASSMSTYSGFSSLFLCDLMISSFNALTPSTVLALLIWSIYTGDVIPLFFNSSIAFSLASFNAFSFALSSGFSSGFSSSLFLCALMISSFNALTPSTVLALLICSMYFSDVIPFSFNSSIAFSLASFNAFSFAISSGFSSGFSSPGFSSGFSSGLSSPGFSSGFCSPSLSSGLSGFEGLSGVGVGVTEGVSSLLSSVISTLAISSVCFEDTDNSPPTTVISFVLLSLTICLINSV